MKQPCKNMGLRSAARRKTASAAVMRFSQLALYLYNLAFQIERLPL